jgi:hypothetical protein
MRDVLLELILQEIIILKRGQFLLSEEIFFLVYWGVQSGEAVEVDLAVIDHDTAFSFDEIWWY